MVSAEDVVPALGIAAVIGCSSPTTRLSRGDRVRVDGGGAVVEILCES